MVCRKFDMRHVFTTHNFKAVICNADVIINVSLKYSISYCVIVC